MKRERMRKSNLMYGLTPEQDKAFRTTTNPTSTYRVYMAINHLVAKGVKRITICAIAKQSQHKRWQVRREMENLNRLLN
jgi:hypothetical protein